ncbi:D-alanyl-D-alanine carboxypeptidase family protein [Dorea sp. AF36-15AT]|uniref:D-alanyl-D-alanine carboxypeptidase family protein n=1 Tax=Dorea sp. AF36-15AT TaxID=2292041 RepID=UPI000E5133CB|nr:D-alanyl-D-alanine carboxypeptidase family protein [Dorea sp. AF36-15AT]RHP10778.1 D-alanyl-D-alanine carboxypeptidase [Dorea sp. AF36-15AT]
MKRIWKNRYKRYIAVMVMFINSVVFFIAGTVTHGAESVKAEQTAELSEPEEAEQNVLAGLHARYAVLLDGDSGRVLLEKDGDVKRPMASTTKIMTCILALEHMKSEQEIVTASAEAASQPKVRLGVREGQQFYLRDLLYSLMLESHNDSAVMIAEHIGGSVRGFASLMNKKAAEIGCEDTYYITPNGLDASDEQGTHSTTARELALVMRYCLMESPKSQEFREITGAATQQFRDVEGRQSFSCTNHNAFLTMMNGAVSGKTGFTADAGYCYVGALQRDSRTFIVALLACGWPNHKTYKWQDTRALMEYGLKYYKKQRYDGNVGLPQLSVADGIPENGALSGVSTVKLQIRDREKTDILLREDEEPAYRTLLADTLKAAVKAGTDAGTVQLVLDNQVLAEWKVETAESIAKRDYIWCLCQLMMQFTHMNKINQ